MIKEIKVACMSMKLHAGGTELFAWRVYLPHEGLSCMHGRHGIVSFMHGGLSCMRGGSSRMQRGSMCMHGRQLSGCCAGFAFELLVAVLPCLCFPAMIKEPVGKRAQQHLHRLEPHELESLVTRAACPSKVSQTFLRTLVCLVHGSPHVFAHTALLSTCMRP